RPASSNAISSRRETDGISCCSRWDVVQGMGARRASEELATIPRLRVGLPLNKLLDLALGVSQAAFAELEEADQGVEVLARGRNLQHVDAVATGELPERLGTDVAAA